MTAGKRHSLERHIALEDIKEFDDCGFDSCEVRLDSGHFLDITYKQARALSEVASWEKNGIGYELGTQPDVVDFPLMRGKAVLDPLVSFEDSRVHTTPQAKTAEYMPYKK